MSESKPVPIVLTRVELYERVWSQPLDKLAPTLGMSGRGLAKLCARHKIPVPWRGFWTKVQFGHEPRKLPLRDLPEGTTEEKIWFGGESTRRELTQAEVLAQNEGKPENRITVSKRLVSLHPIVRDMGRECGAISSGGEQLEAIERFGAFRVRVSQGQIGRALKILDALAKALESRGYWFERGNNGRPQAVILGERIGFRIDERYKRRVEVRPSGYRTTEFDSIGRLAVVVEEGGRSWQDRDNRKLEDRLNEIVASLIIATDWIRADRLEKEEWKRQYEIECKKREEIERQRREEQLRAQQFDEDSKQWRRYERHRRYTERVRAAAVSRGVPVDDSSGVGRWILWAERRLAELDPFGASRSLPEIAELRARRAAP